MSERRSLILVLSLAAAYDLLLLSTWIMEKVPSPAMPPLKMLHVTPLVCCHKRPFYSSLSWLCHLADREEKELRLVVGHAHLLDMLMGALAEDERRERGQMGDGEAWGE